MVMAVRLAVAVAPQPPPDAPPYENGRRKRTKQWQQIAPRLVEIREGVK